MKRALSIEALLVWAYRDQMAAFAFERYYRTSSLIGTPASCMKMIERLKEIGVDEVACLIDFGDVMTGRGEYDLLGPSVLMAGGMPRRLRSLFAGYGYAASDIMPDLKRRLMALMLLHRHGNPTRQIGIEGWQEKAANLQELQDLLWPI